MSRTDTQEAALGGVAIGFVEGWKLRGDGTPPSELALKMMLDRYVEGSRHFANQFPAHKRAMVDRAVEGALEGALACGPMPRVGAGAADRAELLEAAKAAEGAIEGLLGLLDLRTLYPDSSAPLNAAGYRALLARLGDAIASVEGRR